jgi:ferric-dicitrate binding protein FerR (iron transport regulator)
MIIAASVIAILISGYYIWISVYPSFQSVTAVKNQRLRLPDGSIVVLRKGSSISYTPVFNSTERLVRLSGEAFFEVLRNKDKPFRIITGKAEVRVLGTSFLVRSNDSMDEIVVAAGKVTVIDKGKTGNQVMLLTGQKVILENNHFEQAQSTDSNYIAWKTGIMDFKNASLSKVLEDVGNYYGLPIGLADNNKAKIAKINITVHFENQPLEQIIEELRLITGLDIKKENDKITFYQK